jgi:hypothetical protein
LKAILTALFICCTATAFAQYTGGTGSGQAGTRLTHSACSSGNNNPYKGGIADGHADNRTVYSFCSYAVNNPFAGGSGSGFAFIKLSNTSCSYGSSNVFAGGFSDGHANIRLTNTVCAAGSTNPYAGGIADGHGNAARVYTTCSYSTTNPYAGGAADGHAYASLSNTVCSVTSLNPYHGGSADGYSFVSLLNTSCSSTSSNPYRGGRNNMYTTVVDIVCGVGTLPVELLNFYAKTEGNNVAVTWSTASEKNSDFFSIEKSKDGKGFSQFDQVKAAGNSNRIINYRTLDYHPFNGISYYRLKQTDFNGDEQYSNVVEVNFIDEFNCNIFPNPGSGKKIFVSLSGKRNEEVNINIFAASGLEVFNSGGRFEKDGEKTFPLEMVSPLQAGVYLVVITTDNKTINRKLVVE